MLPVTATTAVRSECEVRKRRPYAPCGGMIGPWVPVCCLLLIALAVGVVGCGQSDSRSDGEPPAASPEADPAPVAEHTGEAPQAKRVAKRCRWTAPGTVPDDQVRSAFVRGGSGDVSLLLQQASVRPGAQFQVAVANDSGRPIRYGTMSHIEDAESGERVTVKGPHGFRLVGLSARPGEVGPCVTISVPSSTPPGRYRAVLRDVDGGSLNASRLGAVFLVEGPPITNPRWEERLEQARRQNREPNHSESS